MTVEEVNAQARKEDKSLFKLIFGKVALLLPENNRLERIWKIAQIDFKKRYYNDRLGLIWALINPIFQIFIYYFVFTLVFKSREENFVLFLSCGILFWNVFSEITSRGMSVLRSRRYLIENIQFEKIDLFISHILSGFMGFSFNLVVYLVVAILLDANLNLHILFLIPTLITLFLLCLGTAIILSCLFIYFDDVIHLWQMVTFVGFWASGIIYSLDSVIERYPAIEYINPFISLIENARHALLYGTTPDLWMLLYDFIFAVILCSLAVLFFRKTEHLILEKL